MNITNLKKLKPKSLIVFDLDGTIAPTKAPMDKEMKQLLLALLAQKQVAVIGGGKYDLFKEQLVSQLGNSKELLKNLFLFPTTSTAFYRYTKGWKKVYSHELSRADRTRIMKTFEKVFTEIGYQHPKKTYGSVVEDRGTQVTFSALGQEVVAKLGKKGIALKEQWKEKYTKTKMEIAKRMQKYLPDMAVRAAGHTSVDVTKKGIDKAFGLRQIEKQIGVKIKNMLFVGDAIFPGGNDYAIVQTGVDYVKVKDPEGTKKVIEHILN